MSHFTVLVIGENQEEQLAPFQENNMGTCPQKYMIFHPDDDCKVDFTTGKKGYWENPNRKWDWYQLGGRWAGFFQLKPDAVGVQGHHRAKDFAAISGEVIEDLPATKVDQCYKGAIDFEFMRNEAGLKAQQEYEYVENIIGHIEPNRPWKEIGKELNYSDEARRVYASQPRVAAWKAAEQSNRDIWPFGWTQSCDEFLMSKEDYIENARNNACTTHAVIKDGKWYESGRMGWWGMVSDEKDSMEWASEFSKLIDDLPEDTLLSVYDCHI